MGLTPVFLDNDAVIIDRLRHVLSAAMGREIELVQKRTYEEVTGLLLERSLDAAWLCGYPYLQHREALALVAKHDFPKEWPTLLPEVVSQIETAVSSTPKDYAKLDGLLKILITQ